MRSFFLQKPLLRLLTPLVVGSIAYLLILLVNNNILQLQAYFLGAELYFCLGLALLMQEGLWWILRPIGKLSWSQAVGVVVRRRTIGAIVLIVTLVASAVWAYYSFALGFAPSSGELLMFCGVFTVLGGLLISLKVSHSLLLLDNEEALAAEAAMKEHIAADFNQFKQGINPDLLFESLETLIVFIHTNTDQADDLLDKLAVVYRYVLSKRKQELVPLGEELQILEELLALFRLLPYRKIQLDTRITDASLVLIPGSLLFLTELIIRTSIVMESQDLPLLIYEEADHLVLQYPALERLQNRLSNSSLQPIRERYMVYTTAEVEMRKEGEQKLIFIPKLVMEEV